MPSGARERRRRSGRRNLRYSVGMRTMMWHSHGRFSVCGMLTLVLVAASVGENLSAQEPTSEVTGIVTDGTGAVIATAEVTFKDDSGTITTKTDRSGRFRLTLRSGSYVATVSVFGFKVTKFVDFRVQAPTPASLNAVLQVGRVYSGPSDPRGVPIVPTTTSDLPWVIEQPSLPPALKSNSTPSTRSLSTKPTS